MSGGRQQMSLYAVRVAGLALGYAVTAHAVLAFFAANHVVSLVWPPSGVALAALLLGGQRYWPGIFVGAFLANFFSSAGNPWWVNLGIASGNTLAAVCCAWFLLRYFVINPRLEQPRDFLLLAAMGAVCSLISASIGTGCLYLSGFIPSSQVGINLLQWWQGDTLGIDLIAPLILVWLQPIRGWLQPINVIRGLACFGFAFLCGQIIFLGWFSDSIGRLAQEYWMFLFLAWAAVRFGRHGVLLILTMTAVQALAGVMVAAEGMSVSAVQDELLNLWLYMLVLILVSMPLAVLIHARKMDQEALRESEERWQFALEGAGDGVWDWNMSDDRVFLSPFFRTMYGLGEDYIEANPEAWGQLVHPEDMQQVLADFDAHLEGKTPSYRNEHRVRCSDGSYKWILDRGMVVRLDAKGKPARMVGTHTDITQRKQDEQALQELNDSLEARVAERTMELELAKEQAEAATRAKSEFLANMSHEIRTPISSVLGMAHLALQSSLDERQRDYVEKILLSGKHLLGLIDNILDFSKIEAGRIAFQNRQFNLDMVMDTLQIMFEEQASNKGIQLAIDTSAITDRQFYGDPLRLGQILINYVNNAIKFSESGTVTVCGYPIASTDESSLLQFDVIDNGIGVTEEEKQMLFCSFQQADTSITRRYGGTGLGLAISRQLAEMMDGEVGAESVPGQGSRFWFTVYLHKTPMISHGQQISRRQHARGIDEEYCQVLKGARILLVEDNPLNQQVAKELLENAGATVCMLDNGSEVVQVLLAETFDCVLMDMQMPVIDGLEATRMIRAEPGLANILVIAMTANAWSEDRERCLAVGMNDFLSKPVRPSQLLAVLGQWLSQRHFTGSSAMDAPGPAVTTIPGTVTIMNDTHDTNDEQQSLVDLGMLQEAFPDDSKIVAAIVDKFVTMTTDDVATMQAMLAQADLAGLKYLGHKLKSSSRQLGATLLGELCEALEHVDNLAQAQVLLEQLQTLLPRIVAQLQVATGRVPTP